MRTTIVGLAAIVVLAVTRTPGEPAPAAHKLSYYDFRRGVFALSKLKSAPIVMLGDSLTEAGPWRELTGCPYLVNRGIGGDTTRGVLARLDDVVALQPRAVFLMIGVNDISRKIAKEESVANLRAVLTRLDRASIRSVVSYVLPVAASYHRKQVNGSVSALNEAFAKVLADHPDAQVIDIRPLLRGDDGYLREELSYDGLHLDAKGYALWRDAIAPHVEKYCSP
jgi:lysophospholipase L1-like esterase